MSESIWPSIRRAVIRALRANIELAQLLRGDWSEGVAPMGTEMPYGVISMVPSPLVYDWTGSTADVLVDVVVFATTQGDAASIDQLVNATLQDAKLQMAGLTVLTVRRVNVISIADLDAEGKRIYEEGGTYLIRVAQSAPTASSMSLPLASVIS